MNNTNKNKKKNKMKLVIIFVAFIAIFVISTFVIKVIKVRKNNSDELGYSNVEDKVQKRDITLQLSGTGILSPANSYLVTSLVSGNIMNASFEQGDLVDSGSTLYEIDNAEALTGVERASNSYNQSKKSYEKLVDKKKNLIIRSKTNGTVIDIKVEVGDEVQEGQSLVSIRNSKIMSIDLLFPSNEVDKLFIGQKSDVLIEGSYEKLEGTVSKIKNVEEVLDGFRIVKKVTLDVANPGGISDSTKATAIINDIACIEGSNFYYKLNTDIKAKVSGEIMVINIDEGDDIVNNQELIALNSSSLDESIESSLNALNDLELALKSKTEQLKDYTIKSPIAGNVIEKAFKLGDKAETGKTLCTIFDLSYLLMTINVDEIDISKVIVGQKVLITSEANEGKEYSGVVTNVNINGNSSGGSTSYPVTIRIDETDGLLPGMNADATFIVESKEGVLSVPVGAVQRDSKVLVKDKYIKDKNSEDIEPSEIEGYSYVKVDTGISNKDFIEIKSGLDENDEILIISNNFNAEPMLELTESY